MDGQTFYDIPPFSEGRDFDQTLEVVYEIAELSNVMYKRYTDLGVRFLSLLPGLRYPNTDDGVATAIPNHHLLPTTFGSDNRDCLKKCFGKELQQSLDAVIDRADAAEGQTDNVDEVLATLHDVQWLLNAVEKAVREVELHEYALYRLLCSPEEEPTPLAPGSWSARVQKRLQRDWLSSLDAVQERLDNGEDGEAIRVSYFGVRIPQLEDPHNIEERLYNPLCWQITFARIMSSKLVLLLLV